MSWLFTASAASPHSGWWFVDLALRGTVLLGVVLVILTLAKRRSAAHRYLLGMVGMLALPLLPVAMISLPAGFGVLPSFFANASMQTEAGVGASAAAVMLPPWLWAILAVWAMVGLALGGRSLAASRRLDGFFRAGRSLARIEAAAASASQKMLSPAPQVRLSDAVDVPITFGLWAPKILLPADATEWDEDRLSWVLLHEQAHIVRRDPAAQAVTIAICCLFWWQPLVWRLSQRLDLEREHAADDLVLAQRGDAVGYARLLVDIADSLRGRPMSAFGLPMARPSQLKARLHAMFDHQVDRRRSDRGQALIAFIVLGIFLIPLAAMPARGGGAEPEVTAAETISVIGTTRGHFASRGHGHRSGHQGEGHASGDHGSEHRSNRGHSGHQGHDSGAPER